MSKKIIAPTSTQYEVEYHRLPEDLQEAQGDLPRVVRSFADPAAAAAAFDSALAGDSPFEKNFGRRKELRRVERTVLRRGDLVFDEPAPAPTIELKTLRTLSSLLERAECYVRDNDRGVGSVDPLALIGELVMMRSQLDALLPKRPRMRVALKKTS